MATTLWMKELYDQNQERILRESQTMANFYTRPVATDRPDDKPDTAEELLDRAERAQEMIRALQKRKANEKLWKPYLDKQKRSEQTLVEVVPSWEQVVAFL